MCVCACVYARVCVRDVFKHNALTLRLRKASRQCDVGYQAKELSYLLWWKNTRVWVCGSGDEQEQIHEGK